MLTLVKITVSALLIFLVNEVVIGRSKPLLGSLIASLPLVSLITFFWIYFDTKGNAKEQVEKLASHSTGVFWFVLPSLPMFLIFPYLIRKGISFWVCMGVCCLVTMVLYAIMVVILKRFGMTL